MKRSQDGRGSELQTPETVCFYLQAREAQLKLSIKEDCTGSQKFREVRLQAGRDTEKEFIFSSLASGFALLWDRLPLDSNRDHPWALQANGCL